VRRRLDTEMVRRGMVDSRARAATAIGEGNVLVSGAVADKPSRLVAPGEPIEMRRVARFVSRGGEKLDHALEVFGVDPSGRRCLDVGASTGGFTDCLLQRGAASVLALDVGKGQIDTRLRSDPRVEVMEGVNARDLAAAGVAPGYELAVADVSFISVLLVLPAMASVTTGDLVVLVKPQFEAGRERVERGGVVRSASVHRDVVSEVVEGATALGLGARDVVPSPLRGPAGNVEFFVHLIEGDPCVVGEADIARAVERAHEGLLR